jgi:GxxExxY protein
VYHGALCCGLIEAKIRLASRKLVEVCYTGKLCGEPRIDIAADSRIVLELKALAALDGSHIARAISYPKATGPKLAILIDFCVRGLETKRVVL